MSDLCLAARYFDLPSAMVARSYLESKGLFAVTPDYNFGSVNWHMTFALSGMRVMVREENLAAAQELLNQNSEKAENLSTLRIGPHLPGQITTMVRNKYPDISARAGTNRFCEKHGQPKMSAMRSLVER